MIAAFTNYPHWFQPSAVRYISFFSNIQVGLGSCWWWSKKLWQTSNRPLLGFYGAASHKDGEGNGNPLQYSCLEHPMDWGAWWASVHGVAKSWTWLSDFTFHFDIRKLSDLFVSPVAVPWAPVNPVTPLWPHPTRSNGQPFSNGSTHHQSPKLLSKEETHPRNFANITHSSFARIAVFLRHTEPCDHSLFVPSFFL